MAARTLNGDETVLGPVSYLVVEFPGNKMTGKGLRVLVDLVDKGLIRILDLVFVTRAGDGDTRVVELNQLEADDELDLTVFEGVSSGVLDDSDIVDARTVIAPGSSAGVLLFENRWAAPFAEALREGGGELVAAGYVPHDVLVASLEATGH